MGRPVMWFEIGCQNREKTSEFYAKVFDWTIKPGEMSTDIDTNNDVGINGHITALGHEPHNYINLYIGVDDIDAQLQAIEAAGGQTVVPRTPIPNGGHFAWFTDPEGNMLGLWESASSA